MDADPISPVALARVRALLTPVGRMKANDFAKFTAKVRSESFVRLGDISPDSRPERNLFSPLAFPNGFLLYNFVTSASQEDKNDIIIFETFRAPLLVLGICPGQELEEHVNRSSQNDSSNKAIEASLVEFLELSVQAIKHRVPAAVSVNVLVFDVPAQLRKFRPPKDMSFLPPQDEMRTTTMKTVMCDVSSSLLGEMSLYSRMIQELPSIDVQSTTRYVSSGPALHVSEAAKPPSSRPTTSDGQPSESPRHSGTSLRDESTSNLTRTVSTGPNGTNNATASIGSVLDPIDSDHMHALSRSQTDTSESRFSAKSRKEVSVAETANNIERNRNRLRGRQAIILGALHLHSGRWSDALRELVDGTTRARVYNDHIFHGKGLELILSTMILLAWANTDFTIPPICFPVADTKQSARNSLSQVFVRVSESSDNHDRVLNNLSLAMPDLIQMIANAYSRASADPSCQLPQTSFSESVIRLAFLLVVLSRNDGQLNDRSLSRLVRGITFEKINDMNTLSRISPTQKQRLANFLFQAYPSEATVSELPIQETINIFTGMATVFSLAQLHRKKAMIMRELLSLIIPKLIQARKVGAAEAGIHPAASLAALHGLDGEDDNGSLVVRWGQFEQSIHRILIALCRAYGALVPAAPPLTGKTAAKKEKNGDTPQDLQETFQNLVEELQEQRSYGGLALKADVLRLCANVSEALPNLRDVVAFSATLLKSISSGLIPTQDQLGQVVRMEQEEQLRCATKIYRTLSAIKASDTAKLETAYWDQFLIRGVSATPVDPSRALNTRKKEDRVSRSSQHSKSVASEDGPFLHNATKNANTAQEVIPKIVEGPEVSFMVLLQNPYAFEVWIERLELKTTGVPFTQKPLSFPLEPSRFQEVVAVGQVQGTGQLHVESCLVKVHGCQMQEFPIFSKPSALTHDLKLKTSKLRREPARQTTSMKKEESNRVSRSFPSPDRVTIEVLSEQPSLSFASATLPQSTLSLLDGEMYDFSIEVQNTSQCLPINWLSVETWTTTDSGLTLVPTPTNALVSKDQAGDKRTIRPSSKSSADFSVLEILPSARERLDINIQGRMQVRQGSVKIEYGHENAAAEEATVYTRSTDFSFGMNVKPSVVVEGFRIVKLSNDNRVTRSEKPERAIPTQDMGCVFRVFNACTEAMAVQFESKLTGNESIEASAQGIIQPAQSNDFFVTLPDLSLSKSKKHNSILLNEASSSSAVARIAEFVRGTWTQTKTSRSGDIDLSDMQKLNQPEHVSTDSGFSLSIDATSSEEEGQDAEGLSVDQQDDNRVSIRTDTILSLKVKISNMSRSLKQPLLSVQAFMAHSGEEAMSRILWNDTLEKSVPSLEPNTTKKVEYRFAVLSSGMYEIRVTADDKRENCDSGQEEVDCASSKTTATCMLTVEDDL